jgi:GGDEF domain-containing protein
VAVRSGWRRWDPPFALAMIDLDHFRDVNRLPGSTPR